jgi:TPR repeat protein
MRDLNENINELIENYEKAVEAGDFNTQSKILMELSYMATVNQNREAFFQMGKIYFLGKGVPKSYNESFMFLTNAAKLGHQEAAFLLSKIPADVNMEDYFDDNYNKLKDLFDRAMLSRKVDS